MEKFLFTDLAPLIMLAILAPIFIFILIMTVKQITIENDRTKEFKKNLSAENRKLIDDYEDAKKTTFWEALNYGRKKDKKEN